MATPARPLPLFLGDLPQVRLPVRLVLVQGPGQDRGLFLGHFCVSLGVQASASPPSRSLPPRPGNPSQRQLSRYGWRPADPPRRPVLFINPGSGDSKAARAGLAERAREVGIEAVILVPGQDLAALAGDAAGTRNHFALDVGVDRHDLTGAIDAFTGGVGRRRPQSHRSEAASGGCGTLSS